MAGTFSQIYIHNIFAVKFRAALILPSWEEELYKYISGIIRNKNQKPIAVNGNLVHIHILIGMQPSCCLSDLIREIKKSSNEFISERKFTSSKFQWQEGFDAFSCCRSNLDQVVKYIQNQKEHHKKIDFKSEYINHLNSLGICYKPEHLFDFF